MGGIDLVSLSEVYHLHQGEQIDLLPKDYPEGHHDKVELDACQLFIQESSNSVSKGSDYDTTYEVEVFSSRTMMADLTSHLLLLILKIEHLQRINPKSPLAFLVVRPRLVPWPAQFRIVWQRWTFCAVLYVEPTDAFILLAHGSEDD